MRFVYLAVFLVLLTILPLKLKYDFGKVDREAANMASFSLNQRDVTGPLQRLGFVVNVDRDGVSGSATTQDCSLQIESLHVIAQRLGVVTNMSRDYQRTDFLSDGRLVPDFPYIQSLYGYISYIFWRSAGFQAQFTPAVAVLQNGKCPELAPLRT